MKRLIVILGVVATSISAILVRWSSAPSLVLVMYRMFITMVLLAPATLLKSGNELRAMTRREWLMCIASGAFLGMHFVCYFESLQWTSIAASVVLCDTEVLFVALATVLIFRKKLSGKAWLAVLMAFGGSVIIATAETSVGADVLRGDLIALCSAFCMAVYTMIGSVCRKRISTTAYTFLVYLTATVTVTIVTLASGVPLTGYAPLNWLTALGLAVFPTLLGHSVFSWGLKYLPAAFISTAKLLEPVLASMLGWILFREAPGWQVALGGAVVIAGIALYSRVEAAQQKEE